jgi:hypothetical protein
MLKKFSGEYAVQCIVTGIPLCSEYSYSDAFRGCRVLNIHNAKHGHKDRYYVVKYVSIEAIETRAMV